MSAGGIFQMAGKAADLTNKIRLELSKPEYGVRLWRHGAGNVPMADAVSVRRAGGLLKSGNLPQAITLMQGCDMIRAHNGIWIEGREVDQTIADLTAELGKWIRRNAL